MRGRRVKWVAAWGRVGGEAATGAERPVGVSGWPTAAMRRRGGILWGPPGHLGAKRDQRLPPEVIGALRSPPQCHDGGWSCLVIAIRLVKKWD